MNKDNTLNVCSMIVDRPYNHIARVTIMQDDLSERWLYILYQDSSAVLYDCEYSHLTKTYTEPDSTMRELVLLAGYIFADESVCSFSLSEGCFLWDNLIAEVEKLEAEEEQ